MDRPAACFGEDLALGREGLRQGAGAVGSSSALGIVGCCCSRNAFRSCLLLAPGRNHLLTSVLGACVQDLSDSKIARFEPSRERLKMRKEHAEILIRQIWSSGLQGTGSRRESDMLALTKDSPLVSSPWQSSGLQTPRSEAVPPRRSES